MERYVFSRKSAITAIHKPHQPSKPLPMNNQTLSLPIAPPPPIFTNQTDSQTQSVTIPKPLTTPTPQSLHLLAEIRDWSKANLKLAIPKSQPPLISTPPNTPIHLESAISAIQNPKDILSENPKQPTLVPHPRLDTQKSHLSAFIHKPIQARQTTITLAFLSLPHPTSPLLLPKNPQRD